MLRVFGLVHNVNPNIDRICTHMLVLQFLACTACVTSIHWLGHSIAATHEGCLLSKLRVAFVIPAASDCTSSICSNSNSIQNGDTFQSNHPPEHAVAPLCRVFGTVSYYVQKLFSEYQGVRYIETEVASSDGDGHDHGIAASASCQNKACTKIAFKVGIAG